MKKVSFIFLYIMFLFSCSTMQERSKNKPKVYLDSNNQIHYEGDLNEESIQQVYNLYSNSKKKPLTLVIKSGGGDALLGMQLGHWIYKNKLNVEVNYICASSCANYIFTAANKKYLNKDSILVWHGSSLQKNVNQLYLQGVESVVKWRNKEIEFFNTINVDHRITVKGFEQYTSWDSWHAFLTFSPIIGFDYSIEDIRSFGVNNIELLDSHWDWRRYHDDFNVKRAKISKETIKTLSPL